MIKFPVPLSFDWDEGNVEKNWKKHNVHQKEAEEVFVNKHLKIFSDPTHSGVEDRFLAYGVTSLNRKLTLVFTIRNQKIRIISARNQNKKERRVNETKTDTKV